MIQLEQVSKSFSGKKVLHCIDLEIKKGELMVLLGPSGCGKTTLLKLINALHHPDAGTIKIMDKPISDYKPHLLRRKIGYVIQDVGLLPHLTVAQNINMPRKIAGEQPQDVNRLLAQVKLSANLQARYPSALSGGQQQRVGIARALATNPEVILMDEPFSSLDNITRKQLQDDFLKLEHLVNTTVIMVTHDIQEAFRLGDRIAIMHEGSFAQVGTPLDLLRSPKTSAVKDFLQNDQMVLMMQNLKLSDLNFDSHQSIAEALGTNQIEDVEKTEILKRFFNLQHD